LGQRPLEEKAALHFRVGKRHVQVEKKIRVETMYTRGGGLQGKSKRPGTPSRVKCRWDNLGGKETPLYSSCGVEGQKTLGEKGGGGGAATRESIHVIFGTRKKGGLKG